MYLTVKVDPAKEPITLNEVKDHLRIIHDDEDTLIETYIKAATQHAEGVLTWRSLITRTYEAKFKEFPRGSNALYLPRPPLQEVISIEYDGGTVTEYVISPDGYVYPTEDWPQEEDITVTYKAGYGDEPSDVPDDIRAGIFLLTAHFYENREPVAIGSTVTSIPFTVEALLSPHRAWGGYG